MSGPCEKQGEFRVTANQNLLIAGVPASERERIDAEGIATEVDALVFAGASR